MAAIISQMAANKRARQKRNFEEIHSDKCVYEIPPFEPPAFDPLIHNKYVRAKKNIQDRKKDLVITETRIKKKEKSDQVNSRLCLLTLGISLICIMAFYITLILHDVKRHLP